MTCGRIITTVTLLSRVDGDAHPASNGGGVWMFRERADFHPEAALTEHPNRAFAADRFNEAHFDSKLLTDTPVQGEGTRLCL